MDVQFIKGSYWWTQWNSPNVDLQAKFANISRIDISASDSDIQIYLKSEIGINNRLSLFAAKDATLEEDIIKIVSEKATGM
jgi:hypothetical protein